MVFVLPQGPSPGQTIGQGVAGALGTLSDQLGSFQENKKIQDVLGQIDRTTDPTEAIKLIGGAGISQNSKELLLNQYGNFYKQQQETQLKGLELLRKDREKLQEEQKSQNEAAILAKHAAGEELTPEERAQLSPTSLRSIIASEKQTFEPEEAKLEAKRVSDLATRIEEDFSNIRNEEFRLDRMEELEESGNLTTPLMYEFANKMGFPIGILNNPDTEEYIKLQQDFVRDVNDVFRGQIRVFEIEQYLKTIPTLANSPEGRRRIIQNRRLLSLAKRMRYEAYRDIIKENKGIKPRNLGLLIEERVGDKLDNIQREYRNNLQKPLAMKDAQGRVYDIPLDKLEQAKNKGLTEIL
jgi:hypothetical protein